MDLRHSQCLEKFHNIGVNNFILNSFFCFIVTWKIIPMRKSNFFITSAGGAKCAKNLMCSRIASEMEWKTKEERKIIKALFIFGEKWKGMLKFYGNKFIFDFIRISEFARFNSSDWIRKKNSQTPHTQELKMKASSSSSPYFSASEFRILGTSVNYT